MALTLDQESSSVIDSETLVEYVAKTYRRGDQDTMLACAPALRALANNRSFMVDQLNAQLYRWREFQQGNPYTAQTMMFGGGNGFIVRANIWTPPSEDKVTREAEESLFVYQVPHDHNFSFLTVGYLGSGYETDIYEYDPDAVVGMEGEHVKLQFLERTSLPQGKMMFYRASRDVHSQDLAKEFSISLNILFDPPQVHNTAQYYFDLKNEMITNPVPTAGRMRLILCELAKHIGDSRTDALLHDIGASHCSGFMRAVAYDALASRAPGQSDRLWSIAADDPSPYVREFAMKRLKS